jgi:alpha-ketoglutarate-dependent taurine dioxygenase
MLIQAIKNSSFGVNIPDIDCAAATGTGEIDEIRQALHQHQLLVFPNQQHLTPQQEVAFYRALDREGQTVWRDQINNPWEVFKVAQGNKAGTYQIPEEPGDLAIWNNRSIWHSATGKLSEDDRRVMHLTAFNSNDPPQCIF